ncbi:MAG: peptide ABC transporter substrate-binding protein [Bdellovibrionota bacterium]
MLTLVLTLLFAQPLQAAPEPFRVRLNEDLGSLDWNYGEVNGEIVYQLMDGLFRADHKGRPKPLVAKSFTWNGNKTELHIHLGRSLWSDGKPVCAQNFVDSWNRLRSKEFASPYGHYAAPLDSFAARGCLDLDVHFRRPTPEALSLFANSVFFPVRLDNLSAHPAVFNEGTNLLVNGAYRVAEWKKNSLISLERNPKYAGKKPKIEALEFRFIPEDSTAKTMFELGELDWMKEIPQLLRLPALEKSAEYRVFPSLIVYYFGINAKAAPVLADEGVRRLLFTSLDRSEIPKILGSECRGTDSWLVPELLRRKKKLPPATDPAALAKLKNATGLEIYVYSKTSHKLLAEWAQGQWEKKLGVRIPVVVQESKVYWKEVSLRPLPIFFGGVTAPFGHPRAFLQEFLTGSSANWTGWSSPAYDAAVASENYSGAEEILEREAHVIPLYQRDTVALVQKKWKGFFINPLGQAFLAEVH